MVLSFVHEGGEWIATKRLLARASSLTKSLRFFLVAYQEGYRQDVDFFKKVIYVHAANPNRPFWFFKKLIIDLINIKKAIQKLIKEANAIDCILVTHYLMVFPVFFIKGLRGKRLIFFFHGTKGTPVKRLSEIDYRKIVIGILERLALMVSTSIIVPSLYAKRFVRSLIFPLSKKGRFYIVPNCASSEFYETISQSSLTKFKQLLKIPEGTKVILSSGRIAKYKGLENLVEAFIKYSKLEKSAVLVFAYPQESSDRKLYDFLKAKIRLHGVESKVMFIKNLTGDDLPKIYKAANVLVLASEIEMAPLVILESAACGTPFIATNVGNVGGVLSRIDPSLILKDSSPGEILSKLKYFFSLSNDGLSITRKKARVVAEDYTDLKSANKFIQILDSSAI